MTAPAESDGALSPAISRSSWFSFHGGVDGGEARPTAPWRPLPGRARPGPTPTDAGWRDRSPTLEWLQPSGPPPDSRSTARHRPPPTAPAPGPDHYTPLPSALAGQIPMGLPASPPGSSPSAPLAHQDLHPPVLADKTLRSSIRAILRGVLRFSSFPNPALAGVLASRRASARPILSAPSWAVVRLLL